MESVVVLVSGMTLLTLSGCWWMYRNQERFLFYPEKLPPNYSYQFPQRFQELNLNSRDDITINALYFDVDSPKGALLYLHGNGGSLRDWGQVAADFLVFKYEVLVIDYRGYGKSTGRISHQFDLLEDADLAYDHLLKEFPEDKIVVYGRSLGTGPAAYLAQSRQPAKLILETPYISIKERAKATFPFLPMFLLKYPLRNDLWLPDATCPVYLIHGTDDELIPYRSSLELTKIIQTQHALFSIRGGNHNNLSSFKEYHASLEKIFQ